MTDLITRIKQLLALATGEGNENEKKLAMQRAQELMARHSVSESELMDKPTLILDKIFKWNLENPLPLYFFNPIIATEIMGITAENFGCYAFALGYDLHLMGFEHNIEIAEYAINVLMNQGIKDFRKGYRENRSVGFSVMFWQGFTRGLKERFAKISNETAIILYDKVKKEFESKVQFVNMEIGQFSGQGFNEGHKSAKEASLNPGVVERRGNLLL
jgi:hypothetical protein